MKKYDILSVGDINIEITLVNLPSMPILGREILAENAYRTMGGSTVNTAVGCAKMGLSSAFIGKVGADDDGKFLCRTLEDFGVDASLMCKDPSSPTGITVSLATAGDRAMATCLGAIGTLTADEIPDEVLASARHLHVAGYFLQTALRPSIVKLFQRAHALGLTTSLDTGWDDTEQWEGVWEALKYADIFFPNESEATAITGENDVEKAAEKLGQVCPMSVVKHGAKGAVLYMGEKLYTANAFPGKPIDTTGAGDAFNGGFLGAFLSGIPAEKALVYGCAAGSISVTRKGSAASCPTRAEVEALIKK